MTKSTQSGRRRKTADDPRPPKPYPDFPLFAHSVGLWAESIRGGTRHFGPWGQIAAAGGSGSPGDGWREALDLYNHQRDDIYAGRPPRQHGTEVTIRDLCNQFLSHCERKTAWGEMVQRTLDDLSMSSTTRPSCLTTLSPGHCLSGRIRVRSSFLDRHAAISAGCVESLSWNLEYAASVMVNMFCFS